MRVGNSGSVRLPGAFGQPDAQHGLGGRGQRDGPVFAAFAEAADVRAGAEADVAAVQPVSSETRRPVWAATSSSARSRRPSHRARSGAASSASISVCGEERDESFVEPFGGDGQHLLDERGVFGVAQCRVGEQRADRGQPQVAGTGVLCRSVSRCSRNAVISSASRSSQSSAAGALPVAAARSPAAACSESR